ncbi:MAG: IS1634 family transposase, partial [Hormoscilla sp. GM102CHS1]|nr:IS1634 family transposase [Hormoscilla sp. GM102CHS1]MBC6474772.1 IS1634 family transposase [Hormoscilla sp. GM102CHS1]
YGGIEQRWLVVESQKRRESDLKSLEKKIQKELGTIEKKLKDLSPHNFACKPDAIKAANQLFKKSKYHQLASINTQVVFLKDENGSDSCHYKVQGAASLCLEKVESLKKQAGRFVLATNVLDIEALTSEKML